MTSAHSAAERSCPTSEVRGRSWEDPIPEGLWPRGVTPRPRPGMAAGRSNPTSKARAVTRRSNSMPKE